MARISSLGTERTFVAKMPVFMNSTAREKIQARIKGLEMLLAGREVPNNVDFVYTPFDRLDKGEIRRELNRWKQELSKCTPPELDGKTKDVLLKRAKQLERAFTKEMPTKDEMMGKRVRGENGKMAQLETERAVKKEIYWRQTQNKNVHEWKQIMKTLFPEDPNAGNVERLRKGKSTAS